MEELKKLEQEAYEAACEILEIAALKKGQLFVVGCSTSEVIGGKIGTASSPETAQAVFAGIYRATQKHEVYLATQCCEHLNRALILEAAAALKDGYEEVNVVPQPKAGGSFSTAAYHTFKEPVAVEHIKAHAGMDIGDTFIGMHLKDVAVPVRITHKSIGEAHLTCARTRAKFIGGIRAIYNESKL
jgi:uncharacterized protein (TIGR01440 family)